MNWLKLLNWGLVILGWCLVPVWTIVMFICCVFSCVFVGGWKLAEAFQQLRDGLKD